MKYKLIKIYPESPKIGTEIIKSHISESLLGEYNTYMIKGEDYFRLPDPENYPEFWKLVVEKDYKILSLISTNTDKTIITYKNGGGVYETNFFPEVYKSVDYWVECFTMKNNPWQIHSVKRLSDGEIFTIGDKVNMFNGIAIITSFRILLNNKFVIDFDNKCSSIGIKNITKAKTPLFTTEDSVDIFDYSKDHFYYVKKESFKLCENLKVINPNVTFKHEPEKELYFSTKEKAEEYILLNKPVLSLNDIQNNSNITIGGIKSLTHLVKSKIQQSV